MIAKCINGYFDYTNVEKADKYIKRVIPEAEYMDITKDNAVAFVPKTNDNFVYEINGKLYNNIHTNPYHELIESFNKIKCEQLSLFDYVGEE